MNNKENFFQMVIIIIQWIKLKAYYTRNILISMVITTYYYWTKMMPGEFET